MDTLEEYTTVSMMLINKYPTLNETIRNGYVRGSWLERKTMRLYSMTSTWKDEEVYKLIDRNLGL